MSEKKPIIEWLKELPPGYRERAIAQCGTSRSCRKGDAIGLFAVWFTTKEGRGFWRDVDKAWRFPGKFEYPPLPDDGGPRGKPERDTRLVATLYQRYPSATTWALSDGDYVIAEHPHWYSRRYSAKRGLIRFLRRLGLDENAVRWEGKE